MASTTCSETVVHLPPERVGAALRRAGAQIRGAAELLGTRERLAVHGAAGLLPVAPGHGGGVQVNNLHLLRGMLGRPGAACCR